MGNDSSSRFFFWITAVSLVTNVVTADMGLPFYGTNTVFKRQILGSGEAHVQQIVRKMGSGDLAKRDADETKNGRQTSLGWTTRQGYACRQQLP
jgi:hypothetical protein